MMSGISESNMVVIGGGVSGLKAALDLANNGYRVTLLEAQAAATK